MSNKIIKTIESELKKWTLKKDIKKILLKDNKKEDIEILQNFPEAQDMKDNKILNNILIAFFILIAIFNIILAIFWNVETFIIAIIVFKLIVITYIVKLILSYRHDGYFIALMVSCLNLWYQATTMTTLDLSIAINLFLSIAIAIISFVLIKLIYKKNNT